MVCLQIVFLKMQYVMEIVTVGLPVKMKVDVSLKAVPMVNLTVAMDLVSMVHGHVMATQTVQMVLMKLIAVK